MNSLAKLPQFLFVSAVLSAPAWGATLLDFGNSTVSGNFTDGQTDSSGGTIRWSGIATVDGNTVDLIADIVGGEYNGNENRNGLDDEFGRIHLAPANQVQIKFTIVESGGLTPVQAASWDFAFFDIDKNSNNNAIESLSVTSATGLVSYTTTTTNQLNIVGDASTPQVIATQTGNNGDNPSSPTSLTSEQQQRTILFTVEDTDSFTITLENLGSGGGGGGRSYYFAGEALFTDSTTVTAVPEPTSTVLLGAGVLGLALRRRR